MQRSKVSCAKTYYPPIGISQYIGSAARKFSPKNRDSLRPTTRCGAAAYAARATEYDQVYSKPERQADLRQIEGWLPGAPVVLLDNRFVPGSSTPIREQDSGGNAYQMRRLSDGSCHCVLKNCPSEQALRAAVSPFATGLRYHAWTYFWALSYTTAGG